MSFVLKYGLSIALAMLLVGCPDDENEKEGTVTLSIKKIDNVAAGEGDNASVSVEVTIKDGDDKVTGDDAKAKVSLKHKCGSADEYSGSGEATAANAVAKPSIDVPRPAADAKGDTHKCKIQASAKIGDKDITAESNEFTVAKKDGSKTTDEEVPGPAVTGNAITVGKAFAVTGAKDMIELSNCTGYELVRYDVSGSTAPATPTKDQHDHLWVIKTGSGDVPDDCKVKVKGNSDWAGIKPADIPSDLGIAVEAAATVVKINDGSAALGEDFVIKSLFTKAATGGWATPSGTLPSDNAAWNAGKTGLENVASALACVEKNVSGAKTNWLIYDATP